MAGVRSWLERFTQPETVRKRTRSGQSAVIGPSYPCASRGLAVGCITAVRGYDYPIVGLQVSFLGRPDCTAESHPLPYVRVVGSGLCSVPSAPSPLLPTEPQGVVLQGRLTLEKPPAPREL